MSNFAYHEVKRLRDFLGLSQVKFGEQLGVPQMTVYRWESGASTPNAKHIGKMIELGQSRGLTPSFFVPDETLDEVEGMPNWGYESASPDRKPSLLLVESDKIVADYISAIADRSGYRVTQEGTFDAALARLKERRFDLALIAPEADPRGREQVFGFLEQALKSQPDLMAILFTAYGTVESAVKAMKRGAHDFLSKPVVESELKQLFFRVREKVKLSAEHAVLKQELARPFQSMIGRSQVMRELFKQIPKIARASSTVLITGESGVGKELVARAMHYSSERADAPFIKINMAALPEMLVEAELFGYEKGAFTDAKQTRRGRFELADGGTLLLDEISEMPMNLQSKLLRILQEKEFERVGSSASIKVDVRILATSNRVIREEVRNGRFREDLYFRLNVIPIHIPPLRERKEDIPLLVKHFIEKYNAANDRSVQNIADDTLKELMDYHWPGNIRELENMIERAVVTTEATVLSNSDFPDYFEDRIAGSLDDRLRKSMTLDEGTKYIIMQTLERYNGNKALAAEALNISPRTLRNRLAEYSVMEDK